MWYSCDLERDRLTPKLYPLLLYLPWLPPAAQLPLNDFKGTSSLAKKAPMKAGANVEYPWVPSSKEYPLELYSQGHQLTCYEKGMLVEISLGVLSTISSCKDF